MAKLASKAAKPVADREGIAPGAGRGRGSARRRARVPPPVAGACAVGGRTGHRSATRGAWHQHRRRYRRPRSRSPRAVPGCFAGGPSGRACPGATIPARWFPNRRPSRSGTRRPSAPTSGTCAELHEHLVRMVDASATALRRAQLAARTVNVKVKFADFTLTHPVPHDADPDRRLPGGGRGGRRPAGHRRPEDGGPPAGRQPVRLRPSGDRDPAQPRSGLRSDPDPKTAASDPDRPPPPRPPNCWTGPTRRPSGSSARGERSRPAVDAIRARYGGSSVGPASLVGADGLRIRQRGEAQWGPTAPASTR